MCPVVRDEWGATTDLSVKIFVHDPASGSGSDFRLVWVRTVNSTGSTLESVFAETSDTGTGFATLTYTGITPGAGEGYPIAIECSAPPQGRIMSYQVTEAEQTNWNQPSSAGARPLHRACAN